MPFALRPLPGSSNAVTDASDFEALSDVGRAEHHDLWDFNSTSVLYIHAYNTPLEKWPNVLGAVADPELDPAHPCLDHHPIESLLLRSFKPTPEVLRKHIGQSIVAPHRLREALLRLVDAGLDLELSSFVTPANAFTFYHASHACQCCAGGWLRLASPPCHRPHPNYLVADAR